MVNLKVDNWNMTMESLTKIVINEEEIRYGLVSFLS